MKFIKGHFANVCCVRLDLMLSAKVLGMLVKSAHKNWKKAKEDKFCTDKFDAFHKLYKNEGTVDVRNMISDSRKKVIDQNKTRLRQAIKFVEFWGRQERISKKQDGSLFGRTPSFRGENRQLFIHKLCVLSLTILITSNFSFSRLLLP